MSVKPFHYLLYILSALLVLGCTKVEIIAQETRIVDTVYVTNSKIIVDTVYVSDTLIKYVRKYKNPVISQNLADPSVIRSDKGIFYLYSTESTLFPNVPIFKSIDLINWYYVGSAFNDQTRPVSFKGNIWAPDINCIDGKYVLYYSMSVWGGEWDCGIGVAVADHPAGPFVDRGKLFSSRDINVQNSIDPFYIEENGEKYLFWGSHHGIYGIRLSKDGLSIRKGDTPIKIAGNGGEGTYIHKRNGQFYLFQSFGSCCNGLSSTYNVRVGRSDHVLGPYYDRQNRSMLEGTGTLFLQGNSFVVGPGHNAEIVTDDAGQDWLLYHGYLQSNPELSRIIFLDQVSWDGDWPFIQGYGTSLSSEIPYFE